MKIVTIHEKLYEISEDDYSRLLSVRSDEDVIKILNEIETKKKPKLVIDASYYP